MSESASNTFGEDTVDLSRVVPDTVKKPELIAWLDQTAERESCDLRWLQGHPAAETLSGHCPE